MLVSQEKKYVSIFIQQTIDLTLTLEPAEKGVCGAIGKLWIGNPYYAQVLGNLTEKLKSTNVNAGGSLDNELAYHIKDFFGGFNGKMLVGRVLGADSTAKVLEVKKVVDEIVLDDTTDINVFGTNNIKDWEDTVVTEMVEVVVNACPTEKASIEIVNKDDILTVTLYDGFGNKLYTIEGGTAYDSIDDSGNDNFIGNLANNKILTIKVKPDHADYTSTFSVTKTYETGMVTDTGTKNYPKALEVLGNVIEKCDYAISGGLTDVVTIQGLRALTFEAKVLLVVDAKGKTLADAKTFKTSLGILSEDTTFIWNRGKDKFEAGNLNIGLSGWSVGQSVRRNMSKLVDDVEYRIEGVAGVDYEIPREKADELPRLTDEELTDLVDSRINTVRDFDGKLVLGDVLSANPKNISLRLFPVSEGNTFINRYIARILITKLFKNLGEAKAFADSETLKLFEKASRNGYIAGAITDRDYATFLAKAGVSQATGGSQELGFAYVIKDKDSDTVIVEYAYAPEGVMRRGIVSGMLTQKVSS